MNIYLGARSKRQGSFPKVASPRRVGKGGSPSSSSGPGSSRITNRPCSVRTSTCARPSRPSRGLRLPNRSTAAASCPCFPLVRAPGTLKNWPEGALVEHRGPVLDVDDPDYQSPASANPPSYEALRLPGALYVEYAPGGREFYNLNADPYELNNTYPSLAAARKAALHNELVRVGPGPQERGAPRPHAETVRDAGSDGPCCLPPHAKGAGTPIATCAVNVARQRPPERVELPSPLDNALQHCQGVDVELAPSRCGRWAEGRGRPEPTERCS